MDQHKCRLSSESGRRVNSTLPRKSPLGPLDGVPASIKDDFDLDDYPMTMGSVRNYAGMAVQHGSLTNWSVRKLQEAGVIILGKLSMHEYGMGMFQPNTLHATNQSRTTPLTRLLGVDETWFSYADSGVQSLVKSMINQLCVEYEYILVPINIPFASEGQASHAMTVLVDAASLLPDTSKVSSPNKTLLCVGRSTPAEDYLLAQKLRSLPMHHLSHLWRVHPGMLIATPTTACAGSPIRGGRSELKYGLLDGDYTIESMTYTWLANFCGLPSITVPAGFIIPEGQHRSGEEADEKTVGKIPIGLMATGEWCSENALLEFGAEAEAVGRYQGCRPPIWEDIVLQAKVQSKEGLEKEKDENIG